MSTGGYGKLKKYVKLTTRMNGVYPPSENMKVAAMST